MYNIHLHAGVHYTLRCLNTGDLAAYICFIMSEYFFILLRSDQWVGFYPTDVSVIEKQKANERRYGWEWLDGSSVTWLKWKTGEPGIDTDMCARLRKEKALRGKECTASYYFICKRVSIIT